MINAILSHKKIIEAPVLNLMGMQLARIVGARANLIRRRRRAKTKDPKLNELVNLGYTAFQNFLPSAIFEKINTEFDGAINSGKTVNGSVDRFGCFTQSVNIPGVQVLANENYNEHDYPTISEHFINNQKLLKIIAFHEGFNLESIEKRATFKIRMERSSHIDDHPPVGSSNSDWHKDSFHSITKLIFYLNDVTVENAAFRFAPRSHLVNARLLKNEWKNSFSVMNPASRISEELLLQLGFKTVDMSFPANTLIVADTGYGFHAKGKLMSGKRRDAIWMEARVTRPFW